MQDVTLQTLPYDDEMWTVEEFLEKNEEACRQAAIELNRKSKMVEEAVEEVLELVQNATQSFSKIEGVDEFLNEESEGKSTNDGKDGGQAAGGNAIGNVGNQGGNAEAPPASPSQQQDWSVLWSCFENPVSLLQSQNGGLPKGMHDMVHNAVSEMRRYYSRKVIDVLIRVTRTALDSLRRKFSTDLGIPI